MATLVCSPPGAGITIISEERKEEVPYGHQHLELLP